MDIISPYLTIFSSTSTSDATFCIQSSLALFTAFCTARLHWQKKCLWDLVHR